MTTTEILSRFDADKKGMAHCPTHDDKKRSLHISSGRNGDTVLFDHGGCKVPDILAAKGLKLSDLFTESKTNGSGRVIEATYDYCDEGGNLLFQAVRYNPKDFRQRRPDGNGGWVYRLDSVRRVLYRLPELMASPDRETPVFLVEGEKDVDRLRAGGLVATCSPMGAGKWRDEYAKPLAGRDVVIIPDNDQAGREHAQAIARSLQGVASSVKLLALSGLPDKGDVSNWLDAGHTVEELRALADEPAPEDDDAGDFGPGFYTNLGELHAKQTVPAEDVMIGVRRRQTTIFNSVTDVGKTTVILNHCLAAAGGQKWDPLLPEAPDRPLKVIFVDAESTDDELRADTENMLATIGNKEIARANFIPVLAQEVQIDGQMLDLSNRKHLLHLKNFVKYHKPDILVLETMSALFSLNNENDNAEVARKVVRPLKELTNAGNCAALMSHHIGQAGESDQREGAYSGRGASAFGGSLRAVISLKRDKQRGPGFVQLKIEKMKGAKPNPVTLELKGRTFLLCGQQQPEPVQTPYQKVVSAFNGHALGIADVMALLPDMSKATIERALKSAVEHGDLDNPKRGKYQKPVSLTSVTPIGNDGSEGNSEPAETVEDSPNLWELDENGDDGTGDGYSNHYRHPDDED